MPTCPISARPCGIRRRSRTGTVRRVAWTPWTGWAVGFGFGLAFGAAAVSWSSHYWGYCPAPYWGAMPYAHYGGVGLRLVWSARRHGGRSGWAATSGNVYQRWGSTGAVTRTSGGYNAWTGNAWSSQVGHSYNSVTGRVSAGQRGPVQNVYTGNYAYGQRGATYNPSTGVSARGGSVTYGNVYTGQQNTASGRAGDRARAARASSVAKVGDNYYASHDGNVYKNTGSGWQHYDNGGWNNVQRPTQVPAPVQSQAQARWAGDSALGRLVVGLVELGRWLRPQRVVRRERVGPRQWLGSQWGLGRRQRRGRTKLGRGPLRRVQALTLTPMLCRRRESPCRGRSGAPARKVVGGRGDPARLSRRTHIQAEMEHSDDHQAPDRLRESATPRRGCCPITRSRS